MGVVSFAHKKDSPSFPISRIEHELDRPLINHAHPVPGSEKDRVGQAGMVKSVLGARHELNNGSSMDWIK